MAPRTNGHAPDPLSPAIHDAFRAYRGGGDDSRFGLGDKLEEIHTELAGQVSLRQLYRAAALETDLSGAEVRLCHETARATDAQMRETFGDVLVFSHFRAVRYIDDRAKQQAYLQWCLESADLFDGRIAPASELVKRVAADNGHVKPAPTLAEALGRAVSAVERARDCADGSLYERLSEMAKELDKMLAGKEQKT